MLSLKIYSGLLVGAWLIFQVIIFAVVILLMRETEYNKIEKESKNEDKENNEPVHRF